MTGATTLPLTLVLSGGNALGAFQAGAYEVLHERGLLPQRVVAVSIGAVNAALIAGNPPEARVEALRRFWDAAAQDRLVIGSPLLSSPLFGPLVGDGRARALQSPLLGSPGVFRPRLPGALSLLPGMPGDASLFDLGPLRTTLARLVDFDRLNGGELPLTVVAVDAVTGDEVRFAAGDPGLRMEHLLASCGFIPFFPPVEIEGRLLCDGAMVANLPLEAAIGEPVAEDRLCIAIDLFDRQGGPPRTVGQSVDRQLDLLLSSQTRRTIDGLRRSHRLRRRLANLASHLPADRRNGSGPADPDLAEALAEASRAGDGATALMVVGSTAVPGDAEMRSFDFSRPVLEERWQAGRRRMEQALDRLAGMEVAPGDFAVEMVGAVP